MTHNSRFAQTNPAPVVYGRDPELETLRAVLASALAGHGHFVLIAGEAGIGKTTLIQAVLDDVSSQAVILKGASYDLGSTPPYGPWLEILRANEPALDLATRPSFVSSFGMDDAIVVGDALFDDTVSFFTSIAQERPLVLVLEDMQWADHASVELLRYLVRRVSTAPMLVIATYRDDELALGDPLYLLLPQLVRESASTRIMLRRLALADIQSLVDARYRLRASSASELSTWLFQLGEGNPFYTSELIQTLEQEGVVHEVASGWELGNLAAVQVPSLIMQLVDARLNRLDAGPRQLLQIAAVIGIEVPVELWKSVAAVSDDELADCLEQAMAAGLLDEIRGRPAFGFRHALIREALYYSVVLPRRRLLHQRIAEEMVRRAASDPDILAHHFQRARDARAVEWLARAGVRAARQFAWRTAVDRFRTALEVLDREPDPPSDRAWLLYLCGMLSRRSSLPDGVRALEQAITIAEQSDDRLLPGIAKMDLGMLHCASGQIALGLRLMESGMATLEVGASHSPGDSNTPGFLQSILQPLVSEAPSRYGIYANWLAVTGQFKRAIAVGEQLIPRIPDAPPQVRYDDYYDTFIGLGQAYAALGRPDQSREAFDRAVAGYSSIEAMPWVYFRSEAFCLATFWLDQPARRDVLRTLVGEAWRRSDGAFSPNVSRMYRLELLSYLRGDWDETIETGSSVLQHGSTGIGRIATRLVLGYIHLHRGDFDIAADHLYRIRSEHSVEEFGNAWFHAAIGVQSLVCRHALETGDRAAADLAIDRHSEWLETTGAVIGRSELALNRAFRAKVAGDARAALAFATEAVGLARAPHQPLALLQALRFVSHLEHLCGEHEPAMEHAQQSLDLALACAVPFEIALSRVSQAELLVQVNDLENASASLEMARETLAHLRAAPALAQVTTLEQELRAWSRPTRTPGGLSERELEVLLLVAKGLSDAEVAGRLFISRRTVSGHLQSIYSKLGVSSRTAAVAFAFENELM